MTLPYGGTSYGLGEQIIEDSKKHGIDMLLYSEHKWSAFMGRELFNVCKYSLKRPMQLLSVFEAAGKKVDAVAKNAEKEFLAQKEKNKKDGIKNLKATYEITDDMFLGWTVPVTNFPVIQYYVEGRSKLIHVPYGPLTGIKQGSGHDMNDRYMLLSCLEEEVPSAGKQAQGASPNAIHSLDAAHLMLTTYMADFPVTTIHDSFGSLLADMPKLYKLTREAFVELYRNDPLSHLIKDINGNLDGVEFGTLDTSLVLDSEYCFA